jgi:hypothetical protein
MLVEPLNHLLPTVQLRSLDLIICVRTGIPVRHFFLTLVPSKPQSLETDRFYLLTYIVWGRMPALFSYSAVTRSGIGVFAVSA